MVQKMKKINFYKNMIIGCIPCDVLENAPTDQSPCIKSECPLCEKSMWLSEKKIEKAKNLNVFVACFLCIANEAKNQGMDLKNFELADFTKFH